MVVLSGPVGAPGAPGGSVAKRETMDDPKGGLPAQVLVRTIGKDNIGNITNCTMKYMSGDFKPIADDKIHIDTFKSKTSDRDFVRIPVQYEVKIGTGANEQNKIINSYVYTNILFRPDMTKEEQDTYNTKIGMAFNIAKSQLKSLGNVTEEGEKTSIGNIDVKTLLNASNTAALQVVGKNTPIKKPHFYSRTPGVTVGDYKIVSLVNEKGVLKPSKNPEFLKKIVAESDIKPSGEVKVYSQKRVDYENLRNEVEEESRKLPAKLTPAQLNSSKCAVQVLMKRLDNEYNKTLVSYEIKKAEEALKELGEEIQKAESGADQKAKEEAVKRFPQVYNDARSFIGAAELIATLTPSVVEGAHKKLDSMRGLLQGYKENKIFASLSRATQRDINRLIVLPEIRPPRPPAASAAGVGAAAPATSAAVPSSASSPAATGAATASATPPAKPTSAASGGTSSATSATST